MNQILLTFNEFGNIVQLSKTISITIFLSDYVIPFISQIIENPNLKLISLSYNYKNLRVLILNDYQFILFLQNKEEEQIFIEYDFSTIACNKMKLINFKDDNNADNQILKKNYIKMISKDTYFCYVCSKKLIIKRKSHLKDHITCERHLKNLKENNKLQLIINECLK